MIGVDLSKHNGVVDWSLLKKVVDFAIIRAGYGREISQIDTHFYNNYAGALKNGVPIGCYWYSYACSVAEIEKEIDVFLKVIEGKQFEFPVFIDIEEKTQSNLNDTIINSMISTALNKLEKAGYFAGVYSYDSFFKKISKENQEKYTLWVANISRTPQIPIRTDIHQYTFTGKVSGVNGDVDMNKTTIDYPKIIKSKGFNGFKATAENTTYHYDVNNDGAVDKKDLSDLTNYLENGAG